MGIEKDTLSVVASRMFKSICRNSHVPTCNIVAQQALAGLGWHLVQGLDAVGDVGKLQIWHKPHS